MHYKLTKQGVRDLGNNFIKIKIFPIPCNHNRLRHCCYVNGKGCGHILCPDCDLYFDLGSELNGEWIW